MRLHWKDGFGDTSRTRLLPRIRNLQVPDLFRKPPLVAVVFLYVEIMLLISM